MGPDGSSQEVGRLARHDEAGESFVRGQQDQRDPKIEIALLVAVQQVAVERRLHEGRGQRLIALAEVLLRARLLRGWLPGSARGTPPTPSTSPPPHALAQPGREVHARHAARRIVRPGETGEIRMAEPAGKAGQIGGDSIGESHGRRAEIESLHRQEATQVSVRFRSRLQSSRTRHTAPSSPGRGPEYLDPSCRFGKGESSANLKGTVQRASNRSRVLIPLRGASRQALLANQSPHCSCRRVSC